MDATQPKSKFLKALQALFAMLGMVTAYRAATAEEEVLLKEGRLTQSRFLEVTKREEAMRNQATRRFRNSEIPRK